MAHLVITTKTAVVWRKDMYDMPKDGFDWVLVLFGCIHSLCSLCWCWRLLLEWCERKTLLVGWWLEAAAGVV